MSNKLFFTGRVAAAPTTSKHGDTTVTKLRLLRNEYAGKDDNEESKERTVAIPFVAFGSRAEALARHVSKGDQLVVEARIENNNYEHNGEDRYDYNFVMVDFEFGAPGEERRRQLAEQGRG